MQRLRAQSAIEFLTTYGYVFVIIAIAVGVLGLLFSLPSTTIPFQCNFYSGFICSDAALITTSQGTSLLISAVDTQPGILNVSGFNAFISYQSASVGYCTPTQVTHGQYIYCIANFSFGAINTSVYYGTFNITATYCAPGAQNLSTLPCPASSNTFTYGGSVRLQPQPESAVSNVVNTIIYNALTTDYYIPVTITNHQQAATPAPTQVLLIFPDSVYNSGPQLGGHGSWFHSEFSTLPANRGAVLESWIEIGPTFSASTNSAVWVNIPSGIPANSAITIYANFLPYNTMSSTGPMGMAPGQSAAYAQYDNGAEVFPFYDNFVGQTLDPAWASVGSITVNNGINIKAGASITSISEFSIQNQLLEFDAQLGSCVAGYGYNFGLNSLGFQPFNALYWEKNTCPGATNVITANTIGANAFATTTPAAGSYVVYGVGVNSSSAFAEQYSTCICAGGVGTPKIWANGNYVFNGGPGTIQANAIINNFFIGWLRMRSLPPSGVMPSVAYGNVLRAT